MTPLAKNKKDRPNPEQKHHWAMERIKGLIAAKEIAIQKIEKEILGGRKRYGYNRKRE